VSVSGSLPAPTETAAGPILAAIAVATMLLGGADVATGGAAGEALALRPGAGLAGLLARPWAAVAAHLVHVGPDHLVLNLAALGLVWFAFGPALAGRAGRAFVLSAAAATAGVLAFDGSLESYRGLSGVLHGLAAAGATALGRRGGAEGRLGAVALAALALKVASELAGGTSWWGEALPLALGEPVPVAHSAGLAGGLVAGSLPVDGDEFHGARRVSTLPGGLHRHR